MLKSKLKISITVMAILYTVGALGFSILDGQLRLILLWLTPLNLLISFGLLIWNQPEKAMRFWLGCVVVFLLCFGTEAVGVATGWPFGNYTYGKTLGVKMFEVPLVIGINWVMLTISACSSATIFTQNKVKTILLASLALTTLDFLMEPVAIQLDFWNWDNGQIPIENYVSWFVLALLASTTSTYFQKRANPFGVWLLGIQFLFFFMLKFIL